MPAPLDPSSSIGDSFTVSWSAVSSTTRYELRQTDVTHGTATTAYSGQNTSKSITLSGPAGTTFQYAARACNGSGCSAWTDVPHPTELQNAGIPRAQPAPGSSGP